MKKILLLATGGTIVSKPGADGLQPQAEPSELMCVLEELRRYYVIDYQVILNLDSSNIQAEEWQIIARSVYAQLENYDGIVITHGTDTMAYTASMLTFMLENLNKPVVLTGSQMPIGLPLSDARSNLATAFAAVDHEVLGVSVAFNHKIISGSRAVKVRTLGFDAFESVNLPELGAFFADGVHLCSPRIPKPKKACILRDQLCNDVFLLKLIPGTNPKIFDALGAMNYRGVVLEAFGAGGLHFIRRDLLSKIQKMVENGIAVVVCSQCLYESSDFSIYEVGRKMLATGIIQSRDMTTEAAVTKLMWALGQTDDLDEVRRIFGICYANEITLDKNSGAPFAQI